MKSSLKTLIIEDSAMAAEGIIRSLREAGLAPEAEVVASAAELREALVRQPWDLVISDYVLPGFGGREALDIFLERGFDIPFICVSGKIGEEEAAEMVRAGAQAFVSKSHLSRLGAIVEVELQAARARRERKQVVQMSTHLAAIVEGTDDAIFSRDMAGTILTWNAAAEKIYGYCASEAIGCPVTIIVPPDRTQEVVDITGRLEAGQRIERMETTRVRKDGSPLRISMTISPVRDEGGRVIGASIIARDITRRWQLEQERENLIEELRGALARVKQLSGLLPICSSCKRIRDEQDQWQQVEVYVHNHSQADFTHGICPDCAKELYPDLYERLASKH